MIHNKHQKLSVAFLVLLFTSTGTTAPATKVVGGLGVVAAATLGVVACKNKKVASQIKKMWKHRHRNKVLLGLLLATVSGVVYCKRGAIASFWENPVASNGSTPELEESGTPTAVEGGDLPQANSESEDAARKNEEEVERAWIDGRIQALMKNPFWKEYGLEALALGSLVTVATWWFSR